MGLVIFYVSSALCIIKLNQAKVRKLLGKMTQWGIQKKYGNNFSFSESEMERTVILRSDQFVS